MQNIQILKTAFVAFKDHYGVDVEAILREPNISSGDRRKELRKQLIEPLAQNLSVSADELNKAYKLSSGDEFYSFKKGWQPQTTPMLLLNEAGYQFVLDNLDDPFTVVTYFYDQLLNLESQSNNGTLTAASLITAGILAIGSTAASTIIKNALKTTFKLALEGFLASPLFKVTIVTAIVALVVDLVLFLAGLDREFNGMVVNESARNLQVKNWREGVLTGADKPSSNLYMRHGYMDMFFEDLIGGAGINLPAVVTDIDGDKAYSSGYFNGIKYTGFLGVQGFMLFTDADSSDQNAGYVLGFNRPYAQPSSINALTTTTAINDHKTYFDETLWPEAAISVNETTTFGSISGCCNGNRAAEAHGVWLLG